MPIKAAADPPTRAIALATKGISEPKATITPATTAAVSPSVEPTSRKAAPKLMPSFLGAGGVEPGALGGAPIAGGLTAETDDKTLVPATAAAAAAAA